MKKLIFVLLLGLTTISFAQETGKFRGGLEAGYIPFWGFAYTGTAELKYNVQKNMNVGFRTAYATVRTCKCNSSELLSFSFTYDYYFHYKNSLFSPFVGAGLGYYFSGGREHGGDMYIYRKNNNPTCFARVGLEIWKIRLAFDYNLIRNSKGKGFNSHKNLDYMSVTVGFYIGGGKWKKKQE